MLSFFRRLSQSKIGNWIMALVLIAIIAGFALADLSNFGTGIPGFGLPSTTLAKVGDQEVDEREMQAAMDRHLTEVRKQNPTADYATVAKDFDPLLSDLIDQKVIIAFANKYGFRVSKRLVDAEVSQLPGVRGYNGQPDVQAYQQFLSKVRLTDQQVRQILKSEITGRYMLLPLASSARIPTGVAKPYATMYLEERQGEAAVIPFTAFINGLKPTDADLNQYYNANRGRYVVPEQRAVRFARIGAEQAGNPAATDQEITKYYNDNQALYATKDTRDLSQVVVQDQGVANGIAARAKAGQTLAAAAAPAGANAAISTPAGQTRQDYAAVAGDAAANAVFSAANGALVGPVKTGFGWAIVKVEGVKTVAGKSLAAAKTEIASKITEQKKAEAIADLVDKVQEKIDDGANFAEAATQFKLPVTTTPLVLANGTSRTDAAYRLPTELTTALQAGFDSSPTEQPDIVQLSDKSGYVLVSPAQVMPAAPAPLASIRDRVVADWTAAQALARAKAAAAAIEKRANQGMSLADAIKASGTNVPIQPLKVRRIQIAQANPQALPALRTLFTLLPNRARAVRDAQGRGFFVVKVDKILPANPFAAMPYVGGIRRDLQASVPDEYARQFLAAMREQMKVRRNDDAIAAMKVRMARSGN